MDKETFKKVTQSNKYSARDLVSALQACEMSSGELLDEILKYNERFGSNN